MSLSSQRAMQTQYATSMNLETRIAFQNKYSRNKQGFGPWINRQYELRPGMRILELGCGTGSMWQGITPPEDCHITLTNASPGMLETARQNTEHLHADYEVVDAQQIPWPDDCFDMVIANMMLYHVPDIARAIREIRRVLRPEGKLYAATFGEHGLTEAVLELLGLPSAANHRFTLQSGVQQLAASFRRVERRDYPDAMDVTSLEDLIAYLRSMQAMTALADVPDEKLLAVFRPRMVGGVLTLPKEYGLFICS